MNQAKSLIHYFVLLIKARMQTFDIIGKQNMIEKVISESPNEIIQAIKLDKSASEQHMADL